jgi:hypothetical protein
MGTKKIKEVLAWHFLRSDKRLGYGDNRIVSLGETLKVNPDRIELCKFGLHASIRIRDALIFAGWENDIACRVKLGGKIVAGGNKLVASERTVIGWCEADRILHEFACRVAEDVLPLFEKDYPNDDKPRKAIEAKRLWLEGKISTEDLQAARNAACDVARTAAWAAASYSARAAACDAVYYAVGVGYTVPCVAEAKENKYHTWLEEMMLKNMMAD